MTGRAVIRSALTRSALVQSALVQSALVQSALVTGLLLVAASLSPARAVVERLEVLERAPFAGGRSFGAAGPYEILRGRLHYAVDPDHPANRMVVDLDLAPTAGDGRVRFAGDVMLIAPADPDKGNGTLLYEVGNRGGVGALAFFNDAPYTNRPGSSADAGNGFLLSRGYSLLWSAWNWDVLPGNDRMRITLPVARRNGAAITGLVAAEIAVDRPSFAEPLAWGNSIGYPPASLASADHRFTVRDDQRDPRRPIPAARWRFARSGGDGRTPFGLIYDDGFSPGRLYELVYTARDPVVVGLGLAAIRDALSYFRFAGADRGNPLAGAVDAGIAFGISQSGRVIKHMLLQGFHTDRQGRMVFDAALIHVAGGGKGSFNHRFAQTTRHPSPHQDHQYPADFFPFATLPHRDPVTGASGSLLDEAERQNAVPLIMLVNSSGEYWTRSASLIHADADGDIGFHPKARGYMITGAQHGNWISPERGKFERCGNPLDHRPVVRALLAGLTDWLRGPGRPPDSAVPQHGRGVLGTVAQWRARFPSLPGHRLPTRNLAPPRLDLGPRFAADGIIDRVPPRFGPPHQTLVPMPDPDGIDLGGIRLPAVAAPVGTYLGWNLRHPRIGASHMIGRWTGSFIPFARTAAARKQAGDPRPSLAERYGDAGAYRDRVTAATDALIAAGFLLAFDRVAVIERVVSRYHAVAGHDPADPGCAYLVGP